MPELPEVETTCRGIRPHLEAQTILSIEVRNESLRWPVSEEIIHLQKRQVMSITRRAKYILIEFSPTEHIIMHLGMSGSLRISDTDEPLRKHDHLIFSLSNGLQMRYHDPRRFGCALWVDGDVHKHKLMEKLGPEPLGDAFTSDYFYEQSRGRATTVKQWVMTNSTVVGVGNIYACEALKMAGIHPKRAAGKVSKARLNDLYKAIRTVLQRSIDQGGTTLKDFLHSDGQPGYFKQQLAVYDREGQPCGDCGSEIKRIVLGQRSTFYCPKCQK